MNPQRSSESAFVLDRPHVRSNPWSVYLELGKARLSFLVVFSMLAGFVLADSRSFDGWLMWWTVLGTTGAALGANSLNQWWERKRDACMERTRHRPLPSGLISTRHAFLWSVAISALGVGVLGWKVNLLTAALATANILIYVFFYTPMKLHSPFCTLIGAVCGAIPPMMGWTAVAGEIGYGAWLLAATLFIWQIPHFLALAWLYRDDYERGGFRMLPVVDREGWMTCQVILIYSLALLPLGLAYFPGGLTGLFFTASSMILGIGFVVCCYRLYRERTRANARMVFLASILYLPVFLGLLMIDRASNAWINRIHSPASVRMILDRKLEPAALWVNDIHAGDEPVIRETKKNL